jgi:aryl-alcohol dehydrogenase-like predicted oxidoreductase
MAVMEERLLGKSGLRVSLVGLGTNVLGPKGGTASERTLDEKETAALIDGAIDMGVTHLDSADAYGKPRGGSEEMIGKVLDPAKRHKVVIASKFGAPVLPDDPPANTSRRYMMKQVEGSLKRLKTDFIDLYWVHRDDRNTPLEETIRGLEDLVRSGKVRYVGLSNFVAWRVVEAQMTAKALGASAFIGCQDGYNLFDRRPENDLIPAMESQGIGLVPFSPLAGGLLSGKYRKDAIPKDGRLAMSERAARTQLNDRRWTALDRLEALAKEGGRTMLDLAFGWLASRKVIGSIIAGATSLDQLRANVKAGEAKLTPSELATIDEITAEFRSHT